MTERMIAWSKLEWKSVRIWKENSASKRKMKRCVKHFHFLSLLSLNWAYITFSFFQICLGGAFDINAEMWKKHLRTASTDSKFMNKFSALLWKPADLTQRSLTGTGSGRSKEKKRATPKKVACVVCKSSLIILSNFTMCQLKVSSNFIICYFSCVQRKVGLPASPG